MSETETKSKWKRLPKNSILRRMENSDPEMRYTFEQWVADQPICGEGEVYWLGVTQPFCIPAKNWRLHDYDSTWAQILDACNSDSNNVAVILGEIFPAFDAKGVTWARAFFGMEMGDARKKVLNIPTGPEPVEIPDMDWELGKALHNASVWALHVQRKFETAHEQQESAVAPSVAAADYVLAMMPSDEEPGWVWYWVRGRELAVRRGHETCPPPEATYVFQIPHSYMLQLVVIAYGDCPAADHLWSHFRYEDPALVERMVRLHATVGVMTEVFGEQPTWPEYRLP